MHSQPTEKSQAVRPRSSHNWLTVEESPYAWEREALDFVRQRLPSHEPYYAWSNFEFIAHDGSLNEVDLLVFSPQGFFLIEIKSRPGYLSGDARTWIWEQEGRLHTLDNPLYLANRKAKRLKSLLEAQPSFRRCERPPFIEALVFCSAKGLQCELQGTAKYNVCLRDRPSSPGIMAAIQARQCPGLQQIATGTHDRTMVQRVQRAMEQGGIRRSQRYKQVGDYQLGQMIEQTDRYQDWDATHVQLHKIKRRIRIYPVHSGTSTDDQRMSRRAAEREFQLLEQLRHPGIVRCEHFITHELGPALFFEQDVEALRLDHYLVQYADQLDVQARLTLMRQLAETLQFTHAHNVFHRALCPQSIWITGLGQDKPQTKIFNWQVAYQEGGSTTGQGNPVTTHIDRLVEDQNTAYIAPEALTNPHLGGEYLDIFSLGAIAYFLFSGKHPAANGLELSEKLRETKGLQISAVLNGAATSLEYLIDKSTQSSVRARYASIADFLVDLDDVEEELTQPVPIQHPADANKGAVLPGGLEVVQRLGRGGCSVGLLVKQDEQLLVLKVASEITDNDRLLGEAQVLQKLRHPRIVEFCDLVQIGDWWGFLMKPVFVQRDKQTIETLRQRLRREKTLQLDLLQRFGEDLLDAVNYLEAEGYGHRDIKPDNIAVGQFGANGQLHLNLFDFSLAKTPIQNIRAGTSGYLDPFLPLRNPPCWDSAAERYAAAMTLYEMATGDFPQWGDGLSDPSHLDCEITLDAEKFTQLRDRFLDFFQKAFRRDPNERFANAAEMLEQWRACFRAEAEPAPETSIWERLQNQLDTIDLQTRLQALNLEAPLLEALDRANILTVQDLRDASTQKLMQLRGVVNQRRRDITELAQRIRQRFTPAADAETPLPAAGDLAHLSIDFLAQRVQAVPQEGETEAGVMGALLGLVSGFWPTVGEIAQSVALSGDQIGQVVEKFQKRWYRLPMITPLRTDVLELLNRAGGVMTIAELAQGLLVARGSTEVKAERRQLLAIAVLRVALEAEQVLAQPRFQTYDRGSRRLVAIAPSLADYAFALGDCADDLAAADPLLSPARSLGALQAIAPPPDLRPFQENRLVILAAAASTGAALSSRQEFYPRNLAPERAIKLSQGALHGAPSLSIEQIQARVRSRYPAAAAIPSRPHLDQLLRATGLELRWDDHQKVYVPDHLLGMGLSSSRGVFSSTVGHSELSPLSTVNLSLQQFEGRLQRSLSDRTFLVLTTTQEHYLHTARGLSDRFSVEVLDFERLFLEVLRGVADAARVDWDLVLQTDAHPEMGDWDKLLILVGRTMERIEAQLFGLDRPQLMIFPALLARYNQMAFLEKLRDRVGQGDSLPGFWLLVASDRAAIAGQVVPILSPGQRVGVPREWLRRVSGG